MLQQQNELKKLWAKRFGTNTAYYDYSSDILSIKKSIIYGLLIGDCLGSTSEFLHPQKVGSLINNTSKSGWPYKLVSSNCWNVGESTDDGDMALAILKSFHLKKSFDPVHILEMFMDWLKGKPKDVGFTTRTSLLENNKQITTNGNSAWWKGSLELHNENPTNAANGALMRNGVIPLIESKDINKAIEYTILHSIITHYSAPAILPCVIQTILIFRALQSHANKKAPKIPTTDDIKSILFDSNGEWQQFKTLVANNSNLLSEDCKVWFKNIGGKKALEIEEKKVFENLQNFETFDPYTHNYKGVSGWSILSLKIALWSLHWSVKQSSPLKAPTHLPSWVFDEQPKGFESIAFVVTIGADSDTYGAIAGPLLAAYHPSKIPKDFVEDLEQKSNVELYSSSLPN